MTTQLAERPKRSKYAPADIERGLLALALTGTNAAKAAQTSGIPQTTLKTWRHEHADRYDAICQEQAPKIERTIAQQARAFIVQAAEVEAAALRAVQHSIT